MINCLIIDDEPVALDILEGYVKKTPFLHLSGRCLGVHEAWEKMETEPIDLVFLDIQMPQVSGLEFSRVLDPNIKIIFTTAFEEYALNGFKVNALDYLLKPFNYTEFLIAASRAKDWFDHQTNQPVAAAAQPAEDSLLVKSEYKQVRIRIAEINYIEGMKDYAKFFVGDKKEPIYSLMSLKSLEEKLKAWPFMRVHRSYIINLDQIEAIERHELIIAGESIPIAEKYRATFQAYIRERYG